MLLELRDRVLGPLGFGRTFAFLSVEAGEELLGIAMGGSGARPDAPAFK
jgi:hypothetical protein